MKKVQPVHGLHAPSQIPQTECRCLLRNCNYKKIKIKKIKINPKSGTEIKARLLFANARQPSAEPPVEEG